LRNIIVNKKQLGKLKSIIMTQEEFDKAPLLDQILYDTTGMLVENHPSIAEAMEKYHQAKLKLMSIADVVAMLPSNDVIEANGIEGGLRDGELQMYWEGAVWLRNHLHKRLMSKGN
jgi:hypothetical protein